METQLPASETRPFTDAPIQSNPYPTISQAWWIIAILIGWQVALYIPLGIGTYVADQYNVDLHGLPETLVYVGMFWLTIRYARRRQAAGPPNFGTVKPVVFPIVAVGTIALGLLLEPLTALVPTPDWLRKVMEEAFTKDMIWAAVLFAPVLEEILLRGVILEGFLTRYSPAKAIIWSAVIFGVMHMNPVQAVGAFVLGLPLGWLYYRTRSLWPCICLHFVNNTVGSLALFFEDSLDMSANYTRAWVGNDTHYVGLLIGCFVLCGLAYVLLDRLLPAPEPANLIVR